MRSIWGFMAFFGLSAIGAPASAISQQVWAEGGIASTLVGADERGNLIYRKLYVAAVGPEGPELGDHHPEFRTCARQTLADQAESEQWWRPVDDGVKTPYDIAVTQARAGKELRPDDLFKERAVQRETVRQHFIALRTRVLNALRKCGPRQFTDRISLAVVNRVCTGMHSDRCGRFPDNFDRPQFQRYSKIFDWFETAGIREVNDLVELGPRGLQSSVTVRFEANLRFPWPKQPTETDAQRAFERASVQMRKLGRHYSFIAPRAIGLHKETAERLIDVIDHPVFSLPGLPNFSDPTKPALLVLQDEIARARIVQCVLYQPNETTPSCAGYKIDEKAIQRCVNGLECLPAFDSESLIHAVQITAPRTLKELAISELPRWTRQLTEAEFSAYVTECSKDTSDARQAAMCLTRKTIPPEAQPTFDCAMKLAANGQGGQSAARRCLSTQVSSAKTAKLLSCTEQRGTAGAVLMDCLVNSQLSDKDQRSLSCLRKIDMSDLSSATPCLAEQDPRLAKIIHCQQQHNADREAMALCILQANGVPEEVAAAIHCARKHNGDLQKVGGCLLTEELLGNKIGGDVGRGINCFASSAGSTIGTLTCMTAPKVRPEQQIALECLSQSGELVSYAGCVGGKLTLKELGQCRNVDYGKPGCYGPNNDIQKFLRSVGINTEESTVVGGIAKLHVQIATAQVAMAEDALVNGVRVIKDTGRLIEGFGKSLVAAGENLYKGTVGRVGDEIKETARKWGIKW